MSAWFLDNELSTCFIMCWINYGLLSSYIATVWIVIFLVSFFMKYVKHVENYPILTTNLSGGSYNKSFFNMEFVYRLRAIANICEYFVCHRAVSKVVLPFLSLILQDWQQVTCTKSESSLHTTALLLFKTSPHLV